MGKSIVNLDHLHDVVLVCGDEKIPCHRIILSARSPVFKAMLENDMKEKHTNEISIPDSTPGMVKVMLKRIYDGEVPADINNIAGELIHNADKYGLELLTKACEEAFVEELTDGNAVRTLIIIDRYVPLSDVRKKVLEFIWDNARRVMKSEDWKQFVKTYPDLVTDLFEFLAEKHEGSKAKKARVDPLPDDDE